MQHQFDRSTKTFCSLAKLQVIDDGCVLLRLQNSYFFNVDASICYQPCKNQSCKHIKIAEFFNQMCSWILKIVFVQTCACVCVCVFAPEAINNQWCERTPYDWLNKFSKFYVAVVGGIVNRDGLSIDVHRNKLIFFYLKTRH